MPDLIPIFTDPVELAVQTLVTGSHLSNVREFTAILEVQDIKEGDKLPLVTAETLDYRVAEDGVNASVGYIITIWDYVPQRDKCSTEQEVRMLAVQTMKAFSEDLLEITEHLGGSLGDTLFPRADYRLDGERVILPRYGRKVFSSKVEANNSIFRDRLLGASIQGRLKGVVQWICCTKSNFSA